MPCVPYSEIRRIDEEDIAVLSVGSSMLIKATAQAEFAKFCVSNAVSFAIEAADSADRRGLFTHRRAAHAQDVLVKFWGPNEVRVGSDDEESDFSRGA